MIEKRAVVGVKMQKMLKVLLVAPTDPKVPGDLKYLVGGENTYTQTLLTNPPKGVEYTYFSEALEKGSIEYSFLQRVLGLMVKLRILPVSGGSQIIKLKANFDLVHCHAYSIKVTPNVPIVLSDSSSNYLFLRDYINWPLLRIKLGLFFKKWLFKFLDIADCDVNLGRAKKLVVFSKFAYRTHQFLGSRSDKMEIIYPGIAGPKPFKKNLKQRGEVRILFVGTWFERKGGPILLKAFEKLSKKYSNVRLTVVGEVPKKFKVLFLKKTGPSSKFKIYDYVPRERLMREFFPNADIFVLIPPKVEGFGFSVLEAMSFGLVPIVSNVCALPELIQDGKSGFVVKAGDVNDLVRKLERLVVNQTLRKKMGELARIRFEENFAAEKSNKQLLKIYQQKENI